MPQRLMSFFAAIRELRDAGLAARVSRPLRRRLFAITLRRDGLRRALRRSTWISAGVDGSRVARAVQRGARRGAAGARRRMSHAPRRCFARHGLGALHAAHRQRRRRGRSRPHRGRRAACCIDEIAHELRARLVGDDLAHAEAARRPGLRATRSAPRASTRTTRGSTSRSTFDPDEDVAAPFIAKGARPRVAILREQGVNSQVEMAAAFDRAGFDAASTCT